MSVYSELDQQQKPSTPNFDEEFVQLYEKNEWILNNNGSEGIEETYCRHSCVFPLAW